MTDPIQSGHSSDDAAAAARAAGLDCLRCGAAIRLDSVQAFRTGGSTGATHFFLGQWAEIGEDKVTLEAYVCGQCRHVEFRVPE
ncbi:MAG TPA: hypothetical protein VHM48_08655 [Candidatus Limnocylindrales bacterium]|nr:hypothetical protein [Candidatus Limnocylindrales bacterium]